MGAPGREKRQRGPEKVFGGIIDESLPKPRGFPCGSAGKESAYKVGDLGSIPGLGKSPGGGKVYPLHYSRLENSVNCIIHGNAKSWT